MMHNILNLLLTGVGVAVVFFFIVQAARAKERADYWEQRAKDQDND